MRRLVDVTRSGGVLLLGGVLLAGAVALVSSGAEAPAPAQAPNLAAALGEDWKTLPDWRGVWFLEGPLLFGGPENTMVPPDAKSQPRVIRGVEFAQGVPAGAYLQHIPYKPEYQKQYEATVARAKAAGRAQDPVENCWLPHGMPRLAGAGPGAVEFHLTPKRTWIIWDAMNQTRRIATDGSTHPADEDWPRVMGHSVGRWEGQTLVVDTVWMKIPFRAGLARGTGVVAHLASTDPANAAKPAIALRADMDALPIVEKTGRAYASRNPGVMHACGHDGHTTILLGAARVLAKLDRRPNPVTFVFQPAEEGGGGGDLMCKDGALLGGVAGDGKGGLGPPVARIYGLHGWPSVPLGMVTTRPGPLLAAVDDFKVEVRGVGGHAAYPHLAKDPIVAAAHCITALQTIVSRHTGPLESSVLTVGQVYAGTANNIIPESATFIGTARTLTAKLRASVKQRFFEIVAATAQSFGCSAAIEWHESYPVTHNDEHATSRFFEVAKKTLGSGRVRVAEHPTMGGEDFSYYAQHVPACFFFLGLRPEHAASYPGLHQPDFDFNDDALETGVEMMVALALGG